MIANGLKQTDLAEIVSQGTLSNILRGKREISKHLAKRLAEHFRVNVAVARAIHGSPFAM